MPRIVSPPLVAVCAGLVLLAAACASDPTSAGLAERGDATAVTGSDPSTAPGDTGDTTEQTDPTTGPDPTDDTSDPTDATDPPPGSPVAAATDFVNAAMSGGDAESHFASAAFDDVGRGAPFDPAVLAARLVELRAFADAVSSVEPSTTAYPDSDPDLAPACGRSVGLYCQVDLIATSGQATTSVVVYWFDDGVTDFSIITRSSSGAATGIGEAACSVGYELLHGGHTPDRFDIAICTDGFGAIQYNGQVRHEDLGIKLDACQAGAAQWVALNEGFRYLVDGSFSQTRSTIDVFDPDGDLIQTGPFTSVVLPPSAAPTLC